MNNKRFEMRDSKFLMVIMLFALFTLTTQAQEKEWLGVMITQATLNGEDVTAEYMGKRGLRIFKDNNGVIQLWIFEKENEGFKNLSTGSLTLLKHEIFQADIKIDAYTATWYFDDFLGKKNNSAQIEFMSDKERSSKYPPEFPQEVKGFNMRIKTSDTDLYLIGLYVANNSNDLEGVLK